MSRLLSPLTTEEINNIGVVSSKNNQKANITGLLVYFRKLFFQIIEGDEREIDGLYARIKKDPRHSDILCLKTEHNIKERLFPSWSMKTIDLDSTTDDLIRPIKILLQTVVESHTIIERYTQPAVLNFLNEGINPLDVTPVPVEKVVLFGDIVSYSTISEKLSIEDVLLLINTYFEICSRVILNRTGEVNKFMGDGVMAYFNVDQADEALHACIEIFEELQDLRRSASGNSALKMLYAGFGISQGRVIEGNMGSRFKTDYTIIGDAVNVAARLEAFTRKIDRSLVLTEQVKEGTCEPWDFINLGNYNLKGMKKSSNVYTLDHEMVGPFGLFEG